MAQRGGQQGREGLLDSPTTVQPCLFTISLSTSLNALYNYVEKLWQMAVLPYWSERHVTHSKEDNEAIQMLEACTKRVTVDGIRHYATPLLRVSDAPKLKAPVEAVMSNLRSTERRLLKDP